MQLGREVSDEAYEAKIAGLLKPAYEREANSDGTARELYREAARILRRGDHYLLIIIDRALGSNIGRSAPVRMLYKSGLFVLLLVPGTAAFLTALGLVWVSLTEGNVEDWKRVAGGLVALLLLGLGAYLLHLWRRDTRS